MVLSPLVPFFIPAFGMPKEPSILTLEQSHLPYFPTNRDFCPLHQAQWVFISLQDDAESVHPDQGITICDVSVDDAPSSPRVDRGRGEERGTVGHRSSRRVVEAMILMSEYWLHSPEQLADHILLPQAGHVLGLGTILDAPRGA